MQPQYGLLATTNFKLRSRHRILLNAFLFNWQADSVEMLNVYGKAIKLSLLYKQKSWQDSFLEMKASAESYVLWIHIGQE